jgi:glutathione synthase
MIIAFFVNSMADEHPHYTTTVLANECVRRGHTVLYLTPGDFLITADNRLVIHGRFPPRRKYRTFKDFFAALQDDSEKRTIDIEEVDVLMLRNDPSRDAGERPWAEGAGILFGREAARRGALVLNDPAGLSQAVNKLYFQSFPEEARAETLISKHAADIKAFSEAHGGKVILKPLQGSGGQGVFSVGGKDASNINQMIEAISRDGYVIAQAYLPAAAQGDIRLFLLNGSPLRIGSKYCAVRRVSAKDDIRSNVHAGGSMVPAEIGETELRLAEVIRPKLLQDGMFLVGIDIVGDKILEVNVFSPGNLHTCSKLAGVRFSTPILESIERKIEIRNDPSTRLDNRALAVI